MPKKRGTSGKTEEETPVHRKWVQRQLVCVCGKSENRGIFLSINETSMYPASVIKLFVMEAVYASGNKKRINL